MDRRITYAGAIPYAEDLGNIQRDVLIGHGHAIGAVWGEVGLAAFGFTPSVGTGLSFSFSTGSLVYQGPVDQSQFGMLTAIPSLIMQQAISPDPVSLNVVADGANYIVAVFPLGTDDLPLVLDFYNAANPAQTFAGPNNSNTPLPTRRPLFAQLMLYKDTQVPSGWVPLYNVQVPIGDTQTDMTMIRVNPAAPFYLTIPQLQLDLEQEATNRAAADSQEASIRAGADALLTPLSLFHGNFSSRGSTSIRAYPDGTIVQRFTTPLIDFPVAFDTVTFNFTFPIPFTNGVLDIWANDGGTAGVVFNSFSNTLLTRSGGTGYAFAVQPKVNGAQGVITATGW